MKWTMIGIISVRVLSTAFGGEAVAQCDPVQLIAQDIRNAVITNDMKIALALTMSKEQYDSALQGAEGAFSFGPFSGSGTYEQARQSAIKEAQSSKFLRDRSYYSSFIAQRLPPVAAQKYSQCLEQDKTTPGLRIWVDGRHGDYFTLKAMWVGDGIGRTKGIPIADNVTVVQNPTEWLSGKVQQLIVKKKDSDSDSIFGLTVNGQTATVTLLGEPPIVQMIEQIVTGSRKMVARSGGTSDSRSPFCQRHSVQDCLTPQKPGGFFVVGSGNLTEVRQTGRVGFGVTKDTPEHICVEIWAATDACEIEVSIEGRATAIERFPMQ
jgi:hypothetical protein